MLIDLSGREALDLFLKCLQLILRHQLWFLTSQRGLPAELEHIVFDLWTLRIAHFGDKIVNSQQESESQLQLQVFSTLDSEDSDTADAEQKKNKSLRTRKEKALAHLPNLKDCLALCYLGMLTLRLPFTPGDIYKWTIDRKLPYLSAIKLLPLSMRDRLPPQYHAVLDPSTILQYSRFYTRLVDLQTSYGHEHGVVWPALNVPLLLFRFLKELALPLEIYDTTIRLAGLLGYNFAFRNDAKKRIGVRNLPEAQLMACLIMSVKLFFPLDDESRQSTIVKNPVSVHMDWGNWCQHMNSAMARRREHDQHYTSEELLHFKEGDVFSMQGNGMDQYLDFYSDTFLDRAEIQRSEDNDDFRRALYNMFPVGKLKHKSVNVSDDSSLQQKLDLVRAVHSSMEPVAVSTESPTEIVLEPGQVYPLWKKEEELPEHARSFYREAAKLVGLSMEMLILAVCSVESKAEQWKRQQTSSIAPVM